MKRIKRILGRGETSDIANEPLASETNVAAGREMDPEIYRKLLGAIRFGVEAESNPELFGDEEGALTSALRALKEELKIPDGARVAYPGSATDIRVASVFGKDNVIHVDPDEAACVALEDAGYYAANVEVEFFHPYDPLDGIIAINSYGAPTEGVIKRIVKPGGFVITNNYTHWAKELAEVPNVELVASIMPNFYSEEAKLLWGEDIPDEATDLAEEYWTFGRDGRVKRGTAEDHSYTGASPIYPDALFVFKVAA